MMRTLMLLLAGLLLAAAAPARQDSPALPQAGADADLCAESTAYTLQANSPSPGGTGQWAVVGSPQNAPLPAFDNPADPQTTVRGLLFGPESGDNAVYALEWSFQYGTEVFRDTVLVTRWKTPSDANAGSDRELACNVGSLQLSGNVPAIGEGRWAVVAGRATISNPGRPDSQVTGLGYGENILTWTITNGPVCPPSVSSVSFTRYAQPAADAGPELLEACLLDGQIQLEASPASDIPGLTSGRWTLAQGPSSLRFSDDTLHNALAIFADTGDYRLRWTVTSGTCGQASDNVTLRVHAPPVAQIPASSLEFCISEPFGRLEASPLASIHASGRWRQVGGPDVLAFADSTAAATDFAWRESGTYRVAWVVESGPCPAAADTATIVVYELPQAEAGIALVSCLPNGPADLAANNPVLLQSTASGLWTQASGPGTLVFSDPAAHNASITWDRIGVYKLYWTVSNGLCASAIDSVLASVGEAAVVNAGPDAAVCFERSDPPLRLAGNDPAQFNANGRWQQVSGPEALFLEDATAYNTAVRWNEAGTYELEWRIFNGCSNAFDVMRLQVDALPSPAYAGEDALQCGESIRLSAAPPASGTGTWTALDGGSIADPHAPDALAEGLSSPQNYRFAWTVSNGSCPSSADTVSIRYRPAPAAVLQVRDNACAGDEAGEIAVLNAPSGLEYALNDGAWQPASIFGGLATGTYAVQARDASGCVFGLGTVDVDAPAFLRFEGLEEATKPTAVSRADGRLVLAEAEGGTPPYQYRLQDGPLGTSRLFEGLAADAYTATVVDAQGCEATELVVLPAPAEPAPFNAFSPNGDGQNDLWELPFLADYPGASVWVFNIWGKELAAWPAGAYEAWDGRLDGQELPAGTYYYAIDLGNGEPVRKGSLILMR